MQIVFSPSYQLWFVVQVHILQDYAWVVPLMAHQSVAEEFWVLIIVSCVCMSVQLI